MRLYKIKVPGNDEMNMVVSEFQGTDRVEVYTRALRDVFHELVVICCQRSVTQSNEDSVNYSN